MPEPKKSGIAKRMQDVYFELLPPKAKDAKENPGKIDEEMNKPSKKPF